MKQLRAILFAATFLSALVCAPGLHAQVSGQWDFNSGDLSATVGASLAYADGAGGTTAAGTSFGSTTTFGIPNIGGLAAQVMKFPSAPNGLGFNMPTPNSANGGGGLVNDWTLIMDLLYPATSDGAIRSLIEADLGLINREPEFIISDSNGIGVSPGGPFDGSIHSNTWYRVAIVLDTTSGFIRKYVNGAEVGIQASGAADDRFALNVSGNALILGSLTNAAAGGYVNSIQLRGSALNAGQIEALGGPSAAGIPQVIPPVPSFIESRTPSVNATGVGPNPDISVTLNSGDTTVTTSSIKLFLDAVQVPATVVPAGATHSITYSVTNLLSPLSLHTLSLVYQDSVAGNKTNTWTFTVTDYQNITLPPPIVFENFESVGEGNLPPGWVVTNATTSEVPGFDLNDPDSDTYKDFVVITSGRMTSQFGGNRALFNPIAVNGVLLTAISDGNLLYADSDQRSGANNQVNVAFSPDYNLTGHSNIFLSFHNLYEQNQDSIASVEYSIDSGATWLPALYMLQCCIDGQDPVADIHRFPDGTIDAVATMNFVDGGSAYNLPYGAFIAAPISQALAPYISPRFNDDDYESKRVEVIRLPQADGQSKVRLRFMQAGTSSWYFGIDDLGFYSINTPVITTQPASQSIDAGTPVTFTVAAIGDPPLTYQWQHGGIDIPGATSNSYTIASVTVGDAGSYGVTVRNPSGPTISAPAQLSVVSTPSFLSLPLSQVVDPNSSVSLIVSARGGRPLTYQWLQNNNPVSGANSTNYTIASAQIANSGLYSLMISNSFGVLTSATARVTVFSGSITQALVAHLNFENDFNDTSGRNNNGSAVGAPDFGTGKIGSSALRFTTLQDGSSYNYVTLGTPPDLDFGATNDFSVSFWAKLPPNSWRGDPAFVANKNWGSGGNNGWVAATDTDGHFQWNYREAAPNNRRDYDGPPGLFSDNNWHHCIVVFVRGGNALTYVDGSRVNVQPLVFGLNPPSGIDSGLPTNIGQDGTGTYTDGNGVGVTNALADDLGIWRRALTANEAASIYAQGLQGKDFTTASGAPVVLPPTISTQPVSQTVSPGSDVTLFVVPSGTGPFTYQWQTNALSNPTPIPGATSSNLTLSSVQSSANGDYRVIVGNAGGSATSQVARVVVFSGAITSNLVVHLKFDGDYADSSGRGNNAAGVGSPTFVSGKIGQAFDFTTLANGSVINYATLNAPPDLLFGDSTDFSISMWVNYSQQADDPSLISNKDWNSSNNPGWGIFTQSGGNFRVNATGTGGVKADTRPAPVIRDGTWHHVLVTFWRGQNVASYVDGQLANTAPFLTTGSIDTTNLGYKVNIGQDGTGGYTDNGGASIVDAKIDDVGIWRRVLTRQEAGAIYTAGAGGGDLSTASTTPPLRIGSVAASGTDIVMSWTGGTAPFLVQAKASLSDVSWTDVGTTSNRTFRVPMTGTSRFFRVSDKATNSVTTFRATLTGAAERPSPSATPGQGIATLSLEGNTLAYSVSFSNLMAPATASHIHGPADVNNFANVVQGFTGVPAVTTGSFAGSVNITDTVKGYIVSGNSYINIHSGAFPNGEIRGQILIDPQ